jgi:hypothetical protein
MAGGGSKGGSSSSTQTTTLPPWITEGQKEVMGGQIDNMDIGRLLTGPFTGQAPNFGVMGMMPDQLFANDLARQTANGVWQTPRTNPIGAISEMIGQQGGIAAGTGQAQAAKLAPGEIAPMMNPYIDLALDPTMERLRQQQNEIQSKIGGDAAAARAFGGSREAVGRSLADRDYRNTAAQTVGSMLSAGFDKAAGLAQQNTQNQQQTNLANAQNELQAALSNSNLQGQGVNQMLAAIGLENNTADADLRRKMDIINMLNAFGGQSRAVGQQAVDTPFTMLQRMIAATPQIPFQNLPQGTTTKESESSGGSNPLGAGLGVAKLLMGGKCDRAIKTNIVELGTEPKTGLNFYKFEYKDYPGEFTYGPMAQDVEEKYPGTTFVDVDGIRTIDFDLLAGQLCDKWTDSTKIHFRPGRLEKFGSV